MKLIKLTIDNESEMIDVPSCWDDVTVEMYSKIYNAAIEHNKLVTNIKDIEDENKTLLLQIETFKDKTIIENKQLKYNENLKTIENILLDINSNDFDRRIKLMSILISTEIDVIESLDMNSFQELEKIMLFVYKDMDDVECESIIIDDIEYFLYNDFSSFNVGEQKSIMHLTSEAKGVITNKYPELLCLFLRTKTNGKFDKFKSEHMNRKDIFKKIPINKINKLLTNFTVGGTI